MNTKSHTTPKYQIFMVFMQLGWDIWYLLWCSTWYSCSWGGERKTTIYLRIWFDSSNYENHEFRWNFLESFLGTKSEVFDLFPVRRVPTYPQLGPFVLFPFISLNLLQFWHCKIRKFTMSSFNNTFDVILSQNLS